MALRRRVGMVFQKSNPFPKTIFENIAFGPRIHGDRNRGVLQKSWSEACFAQDYGKRSRIGSMTAHSWLSGGQQQRLCIARALAVNPEGAPHGRAGLGA